MQLHYYISFLLLIYQHCLNPYSYYKHQLQSVCYIEDLNPAIHLSSSEQPIFSDYVWIHHATSAFKDPLVEKTHCNTDDKQKAKK